MGTQVILFGNQGGAAAGRLLVEAWRDWHRAAWFCSHGQRMSISRLLPQQSLAEADGSVSGSQHSIKWVCSTRRGVVVQEPAQQCFSRTCVFVTHHVLSQLPVSHPVLGGETLLLRLVSCVTEKPLAMSG